MSTKKNVTETKPSILGTLGSAGKGVIKTFEKRQRELQKVEKFKIAVNTFPDACKAVGGNYSKWIGYHVCRIKETPAFMSNSPAEQLFDSAGRNFGEYLLSKTSSLAHDTSEIRTRARWLTEQVDNFENSLKATKK